MYVGAIMTQFLKRFFYYPGVLSIAWYAGLTTQRRAKACGICTRLQTQRAQRSLEDLPIVRSSTTTQTRLSYIFAGEWTRQWRETHSELISKPLTCGFASH